MPCLNCPNKSRYVGGGYNKSARILAIGTGPGKNDRVGDPFTGYSAKDLDYRILPSVGIAREEIRVCNIVSCYWEDQGKIPLELALECATHHLPQEFSGSTPVDTVILMGALANRMCGVDLDYDHGIARVMELPQEWSNSWCGPVIPVLHPAYTTREPTTLGPILEDFQEVRRVVRDGVVEERGDAIPSYTYKRDYPPKGNISPGSAIALDTEWDEESLEPVCVTFATEEEADTGYYISAHNHHYLHLLQMELNRPHIRILLWNQEEDLLMLEKMGVEVDPGRVLDVMSMAYNLGLPQSLKISAWRELRMEMKEYGEVVVPWSERKIREWLEEAMEEADAKFPPETHTKAGKERKKPGYHPVYSAMKRIAGGKEVLKTREKVGKLKEEVRREVEALVLNKPLPPKRGILNVPLEERVPYACMDAIATLRLYLAWRSRKLRPTF